MKIKNNYHSTIILPVNQSIPVGGEIEYAEWESIKDRPNVAWYVDNGHIILGTANEDKGEEFPDREVVKDVNFTEVSPIVEQNPQADEDEQKDALIAQLKELDIKADKRSSVEKLQEKLDEALAK